MLKEGSLAIALIVTIGCNSPDVVGTPAYHAAVEQKEQALRDLIGKQGPVTVFRTTARVAKIDLHDDQGTLVRIVRGPLIFFPSGERTGRDFFIFSAQWQSADERLANHRHIIEYWNRGRLVTRQVAEGPGVGVVSIRL